MWDLYDEILHIITNIVEALTSTTSYLDAVDFDQTLFTDYIGYFRYVVGDVNYIAITSMFIIAMGISIWNFSLKGIGYLKNLLPW